MSKKHLPRITNFTSLISQFLPDDATEETREQLAQQADKITREVQIARYVNFHMENLEEIEDIKSLFLSDEGVPARLINFDWRDHFATAMLLALQYRYDLKVRDGLEAKRPKSWSDEIEREFVEGVAKEIAKGKSQAQAVRDFRKRANVVIPSTGAEGAQPSDESLVKRFQKLQKK